MLFISHSSHKKPWSLLLVRYFVFKVNKQITKKHSRLMLCDATNMKLICFEFEVNNMLFKKIDGNRHIPNPSWFNDILISLGLYNVTAFPYNECKCIHVCPHFSYNLCIVVFLHISNFVVVIYRCTYFIHAKAFAQYVLAFSGIVQYTNT